MGWPESLQRAVEVESNPPDFAHAIVEQGLSDHTRGNVGNGHAMPAVAKIRFGSGAGAAAAAAFSALMRACQTHQARSSSFGGLV